MFFVRFVLPVSRRRVVLKLSNPVADLEKKTYRGQSLVFKERKFAVFANASTFGICFADNG